MPPTSTMTEAEAVAGPAIFVEWLLAFGIRPVSAADRLAAVAAFTGLRPHLGWSGNLRRGDGPRIAVRRGDQTWTFGQIRRDDAEWRMAAGIRAEGRYDELLRAVADHLLCADTRPDDTLVWRGDPADPWPFAALIVGATLELTPPRPDRRGR